MRFQSWQRLANLYDEEVDLLLNDGSKQINVVGWRRNSNLPQRVEASRRRSRRCLLMTFGLAKTASQQGEIHESLALVYHDTVDFRTLYHSMIKDRLYPKKTHHRRYFARMLQVSSRMP
ncbi:calcineurin-binding protein 1-like isoform X2 [Primulina tabacum]|uniref:calcineurin-binding protein 1-like isoform X2 n=1 Tax=Primulina tabacum TaxID=48773 RepID=UPI003F5A1128